MYGHFVYHKKFRKSATSSLTPPSLSLSLYIYIYMNIYIYFGNEIADRLAKEATQNNHVTYGRIPKSAIKKGYPESKRKKMATSMGGNKERGDY